MLRLLERLTQTLRKLVSLLVVLFFGYMTLAVLVQIVGRYLFSYSIDWAAESATFAQIWMILLAAGLAMRDKLHVNVDVLTSVLPVAALRVLTAVVAVACLWFVLLAIVGSVALIEAGRLQTSPVLQLPMWIQYLSLPVGLSYFGFELLLALGERWMNPKATRDTPGSAAT